jgi:hypothetical protein
MNMCGIGSVLYIRCARYTSVRVIYRKIRYFVGYMHFFFLVFQKFYLFDDILWNHWWETLNYTDKRYCNDYIAPIILTCMLSQSLKLKLGIMKPWSLKVLFLKAPSLTLTDSCRVQEVTTSVSQKDLKC